MSVIIIGKKSFIAQNLIKQNGLQDSLWLSHQEALKTDDWLEYADVVVNCAFAPSLYTSPYSEELDIDTKIAKKIKNKSRVHYIMLSSRLVYGNFERLVEASPAVPQTPYGKSKKIIEDNLLSILGEQNVSILRCSNIYGFEVGRSSFLGTLLEGLKTRGVITFDMSYDTQKDFMHVSSFCDLVSRVVEIKPQGVYNVGCGHSVKCGDVAQWVIEGYGEGSLEIKSEEIKGQFFMDISKLQTQMDFPSISPSITHSMCVDLGKKLRTL